MLKIDLFENLEAETSSVLEPLECKLEQAVVIKVSLLKVLDRSQVEALDVARCGIHWLKVESLADVLFNEPVVDRFRGS